MEITTSSINYLLNPSLPFSGGDGVKDASQAFNPDDSYENEWEVSFTNPKNRPDDLSYPYGSQWHLDAIDFDGTRLYMVPNFAIGKPPLRIDIFIPESQQCHPAIRIALQSDRAHTSRHGRSKHLPLAYHIVRILTHWANLESDLEERYNKTPFGSRIIVENIQPDPRKTKAYLEPDHNIERSFLSLKDLKTKWSDLPQEIWPVQLPHSELQFVRQLHESITLVKIPSRERHSDILVFKSFVRDVEFLYHELRLLLSMTPCQNVQGKPLYLVTKESCFGGKKGVCGFVIRYSPLGSLATFIRSNDITLNLKDRLDWAIQITSGLLHVSRTSAGYYSDLKPDNILIVQIDQSRQIPVLIDFEQRGSRYSWSPPEIRYLQYFHQLSTSLNVTETIKSKYADLLWKCCSSTKIYSPTSSSNEFKSGSFLLWEKLSEKEKESAQVYMLGKLLWCIFEGVPTMNSELDMDMLQQDLGANLEFPDFKRSPVAIQHIIRACTTGDPVWAGHRRPITIHDGNFVPSACPVNQQQQYEVQRLVRCWWKQELRYAEQYATQLILRRSETSDSGSAMQTFSAFERPTLNEVISKLRDYLQIL